MAFNLGPGWIDRTDSDVSTIENAIENGSSPISKSSSCHKSVKLDPQQCDTSETKTELQLLDLYSGCGAMSTGLCLGANLAGVNLITVFLLGYMLFCMWNQS
jgi:DNA (cytosine-5)-methyltransferase 1